MLPKRADDSDERLRRVTRGVLVPSLLASHAPHATTLADRRDLYRVPGISLAIIDEYEVQAVHAEGVLEAGGTVPVTTRTLFQGGSLGKPLVALAALRLVQEGVLDLEADINTWLTSWKIPPNDGWQPRVTIRHLLTHTGGLTVPVYPGYPRDEAVPTLRQVLDGTGPARTPPVRVNLIPGLQYRYSSGGFVVLQQLLTDATGKPFADLMRELILEPLGMEDTTFEQPLPQSRWAVAARGHRNGGQPVQGGWFVYPEMAQGGLWTTAADVGQVVVELQRARAGRPSRILSTRMATEMLSPLVNGHVGLGIFQEGDPACLRFSHHGGNEGFSSRLVGFRDTGRGAVVMTNWHYGFLVEEVVDAIAREYSWPGYLPKESRTPPIDPTVFDSYVGVYELRPGVQVRVVRHGDGLALELSGQMPIAIYPDSETEFRAKVVNAEIAFRAARDGSLEIVILQAGRDVSAKRVR